MLIEKSKLNGGTEMKKIVCTILFLTLIFTCTSCGFKSKSDEKSTPNMRLKQSPIRYLTIVHH